MNYLNEKCINEVGIDWKETIGVISDSVACIGKEDFAQPVKPYLRYGNPDNRIIAMPAYVGGSYDKAGIKWISSFPGNLESGIPRAHSVIILNNSITGQPESIVNTPLLSIIRTASVSGLLISKYLKRNMNQGLKVGIVGFGPIGKSHHDMIVSVFNEAIGSIKIFDLKGVSKDYIKDLSEKTEIVSSSMKAVYDSDIIITCTTAKEPHLNFKPKEGSLVLNVSLRDFESDFYEHVKNSIIVDDWDEVCRENTDIERFAIHKGLKKEDVSEIYDAIFGDAFSKINEKDPIMFNPMGMAIFDISIATYFTEKAKSTGKGVTLDD